MQVIQQDAQDVSPPLTELMKMPVPQVAELAHEAEPVRPIPHMRGQSAGQVTDPVVQTAIGGPDIPTPIASFEGMGTGLPGFTVNVAPPDTDGDVGLNHYVQIVNSSVTIFNKSGGIVAGPFATNTLWAGFGGACATTNDGDGVVRYDRYADRWVIAQFSFNGGNGTFFQCIAVSTTGDPTGTYNRYQFSFNSINDYPKMGLWPDGYYFTYNLFSNTAFLGAKVCAADRAKMIAGQAVTQVCFTTSNQFGGLLASDVDGPTLPPAGSPNYLVALDTNALDFWKFHVDFTTPFNATFTGPSTITVAAFTPLCNGGTCVVQPGTTNQLDSLADRLMNRFVYRNFSDHEALLVTHAVAPNAGGGGIRWYELRNPTATTPTVFQQGTYAPDTAFRWMSSAAFDDSGDIGMGFSISSSVIFPSIRYTGRLVTDAPGTMGQGEATIIAGTGSQTGNLPRWGDYSTINPNPGDGCKLWPTLQYIGASGSFNWRTRISAFKFPSCVALNCINGTFNSTDVPKSIPDNNATGITSNLSVTGNGNGNGNVGSLALSLNITHTFIGDLVVTLIAPDNTQFVVLNRQGGSTHNLVITNQSITAFNGHAATGTWKLKVQDLAAADVGTLNSWSLTIVGICNWSGSATPNIATVDNGTVCTSLNVSTTGGDSSLAKLDISGRHDFCSVLSGTLAHNGTTVTAFPTGTFPAGACNFSFTSRAVPGLSGDSSGTWRLCIADTDAFGDTGTLNSWAVHN